MKKTILSLLLIGALASPMSVNAATDPHDFNEDGKVSISDVQAILKYYSINQSQKPEVANEMIVSDKALVNVSQNGDVNSDGLINAGDAHILLTSLYPDGIPYGDIDDDKVVNSSDASMILKAYSEEQTSGVSSLTDEEFLLADVNCDGMVDATDASLVSAYYAYTSTGGTDSLVDFLDAQ